jgi:hypothetical protein
MRQIAPETPLLPRDLYNYNASFRRDIRQGQSPTEALLQHLETSGIKHNILKDPSNQRLKGLFIACPESITYLQSHHDVVLIDNTVEMICTRRSPLSVLYMEVAPTTSNRKNRSHSHCSSPYLKTYESVRGQIVG